MCSFFPLLITILTIMIILIIIMISKKMIMMIITTPTTITIPPTMPSNGNTTAFSQRVQTHLQCIWCMKHVIPSVIPLGLLEADVGGAPRDVLCRFPQQVFRNVPCLWDDHLDGAQGEFAVGGGVEGIGGRFQQDLWEGGRG